MRTLILLLIWALPAEAMLIKTHTALKRMAHSRATRVKNIRSYWNGKKYVDCSLYAERLSLLKKVADNQKQIAGCHLWENEQQEYSYRLLHGHDALKAPWRGGYAVAATKPLHEQQCRCPFCDQFKQQEDEKNLIIKRFATCAVMLNLYPYVVGHLMIIPYEHKSSLELLDATTRAELMEAQAMSLPIMKRLFHNDGFNIGMNVGHACAGGSLPDHLHIHIVPRRIGDVGFLGTLSSTQLIPGHMPDIYTELKKEFDKK